MKIYRLQTKNGIVYAAKKGETYFRIDGDLYKDFTITDSQIEGKILCPVMPSKIIAVGLNYIDHANELNMQKRAEPVIFLKPLSALIGSDENIIYPSIATRVDYEAELCVVIKKLAKNVSQSDANDYILGYTCANDVTERNIQKIDGQWTRAKGYDTFCPIGPCIETSLDTSSLILMTNVNGIVRQRGNTRDMIHNVSSIISFVSGIMTLVEGDIILTGTPSGIGELRRGDKVEVSIQGIGILSNKVV